MIPERFPNGSFKAATLMPPPTSVPGSSDLTSIAISRRNAVTASPTPHNACGPVVPGSPSGTRPGSNPPAVTPRSTVRRSTAGGRARAHTYIASSCSQNRRLNCNRALNAGAYGTAEIASAMASPTFIGIWLSTDNGMVHTHLSARA